MKTTFLFVWVLLFALKSGAQKTYAENISKAWDLYNQKDYLSSAKAYSLAFALNGGKGTQTDRYNAACSWALAANSDSAFHYLFATAEKNSYDNYSHITTDTDLNSLHQDPRWSKVLAIVLKNKEKAEANYNRPVIKILDTIYQDDQRTRKGIVELINKHGMESDTVKKRLKEMSILDSVNHVKLEQLLDKYGWLGFDEVGRLGALTIFLVIQHSPLRVQQKYLPMMREAVKKNQAIPGNLALLEDRVALGEGRKQIYGSQIYSDKKTNQPFLAPLEDPDHVDERRSAVGLGSLAEYLKQFGLTWDLEAYKKQQKEEEDNKVKKN